MKKINRLIIKLTVVAITLTAMTSCDDFLTITPTNEIVLDNYWKEKADVESMVASCYTRMTKSDMMSRYVVWGELRSDNMNLYSGYTNTDLGYINSADLLADNSYCDWSSFYETINYCNIVLKHAPAVMTSDPNFTEGDLQPIQAEMLTLRALCHFYLLRTFRDIPYMTKAVESDEEVEDAAQVNPDSVLDHIIVDLNKAKNMAMVSDGYSTDVWNRGRITKDAVNSLLADVLLWRASKNGSAADYQTCVDVCNTVINSKIQEEKDRLLKEGKTPTEGGISQTSKYPLIEDDADAATGLDESKAYTQIFGNGNSSESIFELQFDGSSNVNSTISDWYGNSTIKTTADLQASALFSMGNDQKLFLSTADTRRLNSIVAPTSDVNVVELPIRKYTNTNGYLKTNPSGSYRSSSTFNSNWIFYRLTDVMLMQAEAYVQLAADSASGEESHLRNAFSLVSAVYNRSNPEIKDTLVYGKYSTKTAMQRLVLDERQRELCFEGKRWFDLVRYALRGNHDAMLTMLVRKYSTGANAVKAKIPSEDYYYFPIYEKELKVNPNLVQNPVYVNNSSTAKK